MLTLSASFIKVANAAMCGPVRILTEARGFDASKHDLACFGGASGQHACSIAEELKIRRVLVHKYSSILSAYGIGLADIVHEEQVPCMKIFSASNAQILSDDCDLLESKSRLILLKCGFKGIIETERFFSMRYDGSNTALMVSADHGRDVAAAFVAAHHQEFGFTPTKRSILVDELRIRAIGRGSGEDEIDPFKELCHMMSAPEAAKAEKYQGVYFDALGFVQTPIYVLNTLQPGTKVKGPAMIIDNTQTVLITPNSVASILTNMIAIEVKQQAQEAVSAIDLDPIQLSIFRHRFMGVAEQMGRALQKTSVSANIKERLDFSCAIFTPEGDLVANAPHVPAMIGSMAFAVRGQIVRWKGKLKAGDVLLSNAPGKFSSLLNNGGISADIQNYRVRRSSLARSHCHHTCLR
jgi:5-oxoprolinase (ATP-hydrolysing)